MKRWMFILPLAVGLTGLISSTQPILQMEHAVAFHCLFAGSVFATVIGAGGLLRIIRPTGQIMELTAEADPHGFREVLSGKSIATRSNGNLLLLTTGIALAVALPLNLLRTHEPISLDFLAFILCICTPVVILSVRQWRIWQLSSAISQPRLFIEPFPINRGVPLQIRLTIEIKRPLEQLRIRAWLICRETTVLYLRRQTLAVRKNVVEYLAAEKQNTSAVPGESLSLSTRLTISEGTPTSGSAAVDGFPDYQWLLHCEFTGSRRCFADFPLEIG
jgi:hypothetical protein